MLFLLNDVVLNVDLEALSSPEISKVLPGMTMARVKALGAEMFSQAPRLQHVSETAGIRLATLIVAKEPEVNAALFSAPAAGCAVSAVNVRFASLTMELINDLKAFQDLGRMNKHLADFHVWGKLRAAVA